MVKRYCITLLTALAIGLPAPVVAQEAASGTSEAPPLAPYQMEDALAVVIVPNLPATFDQVADLVARFNPQINRATLRAMVGQGVQDPTLSGLGAQGAFAVVIAPPAGAFLARPSFVAMLEVTPEKQAEYLEKIQSSGNACTVSDGWLVVAPDASNLAAGAGLPAQVRARYLSGKRPAEAVVDVNLKTVFKQWGNQIDGLLQTLPMLMAMGQMNNPMAQGVSPQAMQTQMQILVAELRVLNSLARQLEAFRLSLRFPDGGILVTKTATVAPDTNLAAFNRATATSARDLGRLLPSDSPIRAFASYNSKAYTDLITLEGRKVLQEMNIARDTADSIMALLTQSAHLYGNGMALEMAFDGKPISGTMIARLESDSDETLATFESTFEQVEKSGLLDFYKQMGMPMTMDFRQNVRAYKDVPIHALDLSIEMDENAPAQVKAMMDLMASFQYEVAIMDKTLVYAFGDRDMDGLIDRVLAGPLASAAAAPLKAEQYFGDGGSWYADVNLASLVGFAILSAQTAMAAQPVPPGDQAQVLKTFEEIRQAFENADPILMRGSEEDLTMTCEILAPQSLIDRIAGVILNIRQVAASAPKTAPVSPPAVMVEEVQE